MGKVKYERMLYCVFLVLPFLDSLNGYFVRRNMGSIGTFYHAALVLILLLGFPKMRFRLRDAQWELAIIVTMVVSVAGNVVMNTEYDLNVGWLFKMLSTILYLTALYNLALIGRLSKGFCHTVLSMSGLLIPLVILVPRLLGQGHGSYNIQGGQAGYIGLYTSSNEVNAILLLLLCFYMYQLYLAPSLARVFISAVIFYCLLLVESKAGMILGAGVVLIYLIGIIRKRRLTDNGVLMTLVILAACIPLVPALSGVFSSFISRQTLLMGRYMKMVNFDSALSYLTSGRTLRFDYLFNDPMLGLLGGEGLRNDVYALFRIVFGNGFQYRGIVSKVLSFMTEINFEMEIMDTFIWLGAVGTFQMLALWRQILKKCYQVQREYLPCIGVFILMFYGFFAGHLITGGVAGVYFALFCVNTMLYKDGRYIEVKKSHETGTLLNAGRATS